MRPVDTYPKFATYLWFHFLSCPMHWSIEPKSYPLSNSKSLIYISLLIKHINLTILMRYQPRLEWILKFENSFMSGSWRSTLKCYLFSFHVLLWERVRGIQLCDVADGTTTVATVTCDSWVIHCVLKISSIYGSSATWLSTYVPQCRCLCIPLLEYWVQCLHYLTKAQIHSTVTLIT